MSDQPGDDQASSKSVAPPVRRSKEVRRSVLVADKVAKWIITVGGIAVILAVFGIMAFLVQTVVPLFTSGTALDEHQHQVAAEQPVVAAIIDEYKTVTVLAHQDGRLSVRHLGSGEGGLIDSWQPIAKVTAVHLYQGLLTVGYEDGRLQLVTIDFNTDIVTASNFPAAPQELSRGENQPVDYFSDGVYYRPVAGEQYRALQVEIEVDEPRDLELNSPLVKVAGVLSGTDDQQKKAYLGASASGQLVVGQGEVSQNLLSGEVTTTYERAKLPDPGFVADILAIDETAQRIVVGHRDGRVVRYSARNINDPQIMGEQDLVDQGEMVMLGYLLGSGTLLVGRSDGSLDGYYTVNRDDGGADGRLLVNAKSFDVAGSVGLLALSRRDKSFAVSEGGGKIALLHGTSRKRLMEFQCGDTEPDAISVAPRLDGVAAIAGDQFCFFEFSVPHPETNFSTLFGKVWYEGYDQPSYTWQSSAGSDDFEPKLSLIPLIFGTLKATFYSLMFAIPLALLAAIYTSEFIDPRMRGALKPIMELMASLPSVVLGFVAALVMAPIVENWISAVLVAFVFVPASLVLGAYMWQLLPDRVALRLGERPKFVAKVGTVIFAAWICRYIGGGFEALFFAGDVKGWLNGDIGGAASVLTLLLLPLMLAIVATFAGQRLQLMLQPLSGEGSRTRAGLIELLRGAIVVLSGLVLAWGTAQLLALTGVDPRNGLVGTYVQRNTLVVGVAMGFAVIPIIYTLAEDALNSVPEHLRAGSLACGATRWQTAVFVVLPTAVSGVFSAIMIGMGRAVGETMIVVMSAGNTPLMEWNVFNGLRALSATIAVELPEAVKEGTLYRVLFLAGLVLFAMTFVINTLAELVRIHFRKRASQL